MSIINRVDEMQAKLNEEYQNCIYELLEDSNITKKKFEDYMKRGKCLIKKSTYKKKDNTGLVKKEQYNVNGKNIGTVVTESIYGDSETEATIKIYIEK